MPKSVVEATQYPDDKKTAAALWDLAAIAFLLFALHGMTEWQTWAVALACAGALATLVNYLSKVLKLNLSQNVWISGYSTVAVTLFCTLIVGSFFEDYYKDFALRYLNPIFGEHSIIILPIAIAILPTICLWLLKALIFDHNRITLDGVKYAGSVSVLGSVVVIILSFLSNPLINSLVKLVRHA